MGLNRLNTAKTKHQQKPISLETPKTAHKVERNWKDLLGVEVLICYCF